MKILVVGSGGREHAIIWALSRSPRVEKIWCAPGNGGIAALAECVPIKAMDIDGIVSFAAGNKVDFVVVAPDDPLAAGMVDVLTANGIRAFGPTRLAAEIESSKSYAKQLMQKYNIPTAKWAAFDDVDRAVAYIREQGAPIVLKADGLALGKGVIIAQTVDEAVEAARGMMTDGAFGTAGRRVVIEEMMTGPEVTVLAFCDGKSVRAMPSSQDHKRAMDGDMGPNTGGMGVISPSRHYDEMTELFCASRIFMPTVEALVREGRPFKGVIYFGLMLTPSGPRVVEYNARFGDPEAQALLVRLESDLLDIMEAVVDGTLDKMQVKWKQNASCCVIAASGGYPGKYETGFPIEGLDKVDCEVFHSGTKLDESGAYLSAGGRVLGVTATAADLDGAISEAYKNVEKIAFQDMHYRRDIGGAPK